MTSFWTYYGRARSLLMYSSIPGRAARLRRFYAQFVQPGELCFDIGAHVGNRTRAFAQLGARVIAVEPQPDFMQLLQRWYGSPPNITLISDAIAATPGRQTMLISRRHPTVTTLSAEWVAAVRQAPAFAGVQWDARHTVTVTTPDALIAVYGRPAFCKIDVEGYELEVLRGLSHPIAALSFEYIPAALDVALGCVAQLQQLGNYTFNWSVAERMQLQPAWHTSDRLIAWLRNRSSDDKSGDIYARLKGA